MIKLSTGLVNNVVGSNCLRDTLSYNDIVMKLYSGPEPATADASIDTAILLLTIDSNGSSLTWDYDVTDGTLQKDPNSVWSGFAIATGTPTFYRLSSRSDEDGASTNAVRIQGSVGPTGDLRLGTTELTQGDAQAIDYYQLRLPRYLGG